MSVLKRAADRRQKFIDTGDVGFAAKMYVEDVAELLDLVERAEALVNILTDNFIHSVDGRSHEKATRLLIQMADDFLAEVKK